jgi:hypothetical protein
MTSLDDLTLMYDDADPVERVETHIARVSRRADWQLACEDQIDGALAFEASHNHPNAHIRRTFANTAEHHYRHARYHLFRLIGDGMAEETLDTLPLWPRN